MATSGPGRSKSRIRRRREKETPVARKAVIRSSDIVSGSVRVLPKSFQSLKFVKMRPHNKVMRQTSIKEPFHVSDLLYKCPRYLALSLRHHVNGVEEPVWPSRGIIFKQGSAVEEYVIDMYCKDVPSKVWGNFTCACEGTVIRETVYSKASLKTCDTCGKLCDRYLGFTVLDKKGNLVGNIDLCLLYRKHIYLIDIKSINKGYFSGLEGGSASPEYEVQVILYWGMMKRKGYNLFGRVSVLYACKDMLVRSPFYEHTLEVNDSIVKSRTKAEMDNKKQIEKYVDGDDEALPKRVRCSSPDKYPAKGCTACVLCFNLD